MADQLEQIREHLHPYLEPGEEPLAAMTAAPRGRNTAMAAGAVGGLIGSKMVSGQHSRAEEVGLRLASGMAVVLTPRRLLMLKVGFTLGGAVKRVDELLSAVPIAEVDSIDAKRMGLGGNLILTVRGGDPVKLECQVGRARKFVDAYKAVAVPG
jgi:hypothetical protein